MAENLAATWHQHLFNFRLDMEVDGWQNTVYQTDVDGEPVGPTNPYGNAIRVTKTPIRNELDGDGFTNPQTARTWTVVNPHKTNQWGVPVGYKLLPGWASDTLIAQEPSLMVKRAGFATKNVWVTPYSPDEIHAAGDHPNMDKSGNGLALVVGREPAGRGHRRRALAHARRDPHPPVGGLARHAQRGRELHADAGQLLRPQSGARRPGGGVQPLPARSVHLLALSGDC